MKPDPIRTEIQKIVDETLDERLPGLVAESIRQTLIAGTGTGPRSRRFASAALVGPKKKRKKYKTRGASPRVNKRTKKKGPLKCTEAGCDRTFTLQQGLTRHLNETHGNKTEEKTARTATEQIGQDGLGVKNRGTRFKCPDCKESFKNPHGVKIHQMRACRKEDEAPLSNPDTDDVEDYGPGMGSMSDVENGGGL